MKMNMNKVIINGAIYLRPFIPKVSSINPFRKSIKNSIPFCKPLGTSFGFLEAIKNSRNTIAIVIHVIYMVCICITTPGAHSCAK